MRTILIALVGAIIAVLMPAMAFAQQCDDDGHSFLVRIRATFVHEDGSHDPETRTGTGFFVTSDGWVVTAGHVVRDTGIWSRSGPVQVALLCSPNHPSSWVDAGELIFFEDNDVDIAAFRVGRSSSSGSYPFVRVAALDNAHLSDRRFTVYGFARGEWLPRGAGGITYQQRDENPNILHLNGQFDNGHSGSPVRNESKEAVGLVFSVSNAGQDRFNALLLRQAVADWIARRTGALINNDAAPIVAAAPQGMAPATPPSPEFAPGYVFFVDQGVRVPQCGNLFNQPGGPLGTDAHVTRTFSENAFSASMSQAPAAVSRLVVQALGESIARVSTVEMTIETSDYMLPDPTMAERDVNPLCVRKLGRIRQTQDAATSELRFAVPVYIVIRSSAPQRIRYTLLDAAGAALNLAPNNLGLAADGWRVHRLNDRSFEVVRESGANVPPAYTAYQTYRLRNIEALGEVSGPPRARLSLVEISAEELAQLSALRN